MTQTGKVQRVRAVLEGRKPDRPPISFWYHFGPDQVFGPAAVEAHVRHLERFDLDFVKVMNDNGYPRPKGGCVESASDIRGLVEQSGQEEPFARQLEVLSGLRKRLGRDILMTTTVFNAWATLRNLTQAAPIQHGPPTMTAGKDPRDGKMSELLKEDRPAVKAALEVIARSLANFCRRCLEAGADGIFLSVRDDWVDTRANGPETYDELVRPTDGIICEAASGGTFNMLHVCGRALNFVAFAAYPLHVINWADRTAGPSIAYARDRVQPAICGGLDNLGTLPEGSPADCAEQVRDALRQAKDRPIMIAPGCTYAPDAVPAANLEAVCQAVRAA
jgi:uroporphyrinogen decarboxylase